MAALLLSRDADRVCAFTDGNVEASQERLNINGRRHQGCGGVGEDVMESPHRFRRRKQATVAELGTNIGGDNRLNFLCGAFVLGPHSASISRSHRAAKLRRDSRRAL